MKPYDCIECGGTGVVGSYGGGLIECPECFGSGLNWITVSSFIEKLIENGWIEIRKED